MREESYIKSKLKRKGLELKDECKGGEVFTVYDILQRHGIDTDNLGLVGRLDQDTSGVILFTDVIDSSCISLTIYIYIYICITLIDVGK